MGPNIPLDTSLPHIKLTNFQLVSHSALCPATTDEFVSVP